jgi:hypothetical protein
VEAFRAIEGTDGHICLSKTPIDGFRSVMVDGEEVVIVADGWIEAMKKLYSIMNWGSFNPMSNE